MLWNSSVLRNNLQDVCKWLVTVLIYAWKQCDNGTVACQTDHYIMSECDIMNGDEVELIDYRSCLVYRCTQSIL